MVGKFAMGYKGLGRVGPTDYWRATEWPDLLPAIGRQLYLRLNVTHGGRRAAGWMQP